MNVQKQVCGLDQSRKLYTLGISKTGHLFSWVFDKLNTQWDISNRCVESHEMLKTIAYPAFTVAELGVMIGWLAPILDEGNEAFDRANSLIYLLENMHLSIDIVNDRLNS